MPFDPLLPLQATPTPQQYGPDLNLIARLQDQSMRQQMMQQELAGQNAIRQLYTDPNNFLPNGMPTPNAVRGIMAASPETGMNYVSTLYNQMAAVQRIKNQGQQNLDRIQNKWLGDVVAPAVTEYDNTLAKTGSQQQAQDAAQKSLSEGRDDFIRAGLVPADDADNLLPRQYDDSKMRARIQGFKGWQDAQRIKVEQQRAQTEELRSRTAEKRAENIDERGQRQAQLAQWGEPTNVTVAGQPQPVPARLYKPTGQYYPLGKTPNDSQPLNVTGIPKSGAFGTDTGPVQILGNTALSGQDYLNSLPKGERETVDLMVQGKSIPPSSFSMWRPNMMRMIAEAKQVDPNFDEATWGRRYRTLTSYSGQGQDAQRLNSVNQAIQHASLLWEQAKKLGNFGGVLTPLNPLKRLYQTKTGEPEYKVFEQTANALTEELTRAFRGSAGAVHDIVEWRKGLDDADSPKTIREEISNAMDLLKARLNVERDSYDRTMGPYGDFNKFLQPKTKESLKKVPWANEITGDDGPFGKKETQQTQGVQSIPNPNHPPDIVQNG